MLIHLLLGAIVRKAVAVATSSSLFLSAMISAPLLATAASAATPATAKSEVTASSADVSANSIDVRDASDPATAFWGFPRPTQTGTFKNVQIYPGKVVGQTVTITSAPAVGNITGTAVLKAGNRSVTTSFVWTDGCNWTLQMAQGSGSGNSPRYKTKINIDKVSGSISAVNCQRTLNLSVHGYKIGNRTANIKLAPIPGGFEGSKTFKKLAVGQTKYSSVTVTVSTSKKYASLDGDLSTNLGDFTANAKVSRAGGTYTQSLNVTGANLKIEKGGVSFKNFRFSASSKIPASGCATFDNSFGGTFTMKNKDYSINGARLVITCGKVTTFEFKITVSHTEPATGITKSATLALAWTNTPGTTQDLTDPSLGDDNGHIGTIRYQKGLFGYVNLSESRHFSKKYKNKHFTRDVTMGVVFGLAIYTTPNKPTGPWNAMIGAGGYFDADRVSGSFGCVYAHTTSDDFSCQGELRLNPSWAGVYHAHWDGI